MTKVKANDKKLAEFELLRLLDQAYADGITKVGNAGAAYESATKDEQESTERAMRLLDRIGLFIHEVTMEMSPERRREYCVDCLIPVIHANMGERARDYLESRAEDFRRIYGVDPMTESRAKEEMVRRVENVMFGFLDPEAVSGEEKLVELADVVAEKHGLTRSEFLFLCDILNGALMDTSAVPREWVLLEVSDAIKFGSGVKWDVAEDFIEVIQGMDDGGAKALYDAIGQWWAVASKYTSEGIMKAAMSQAQSIRIG